MARMIGGNTLAASVPTPGRGGVGVNMHIVVAAVGIGAFGFFDHITKHQPVSRGLIGTFILLLVLSIVDLIGGVASDIAGAIAMLALGATMLTHLGTVLAAITGTAKKISGK